ncbi:alcohol dehydrogenase catalytic domain-containing protein [Paraburkholderia sp. DHOC27]|uniref:alcohol dehydrogenase catalytic domain-containing protein n=1 Tax=Paraburkholderia sp. DHOC27 TaxID=2303330 RepID=UPI000E3BCC39|nr:Zn-dependent oxidoreductase [Paraburkholderia sp. DHOC27]RFU49717.1 Zn-dependent oxidoreductase [Paraburkholderia sp. DHOC27]
MKAICVTATRDLEVRDVTAPTEAAAGHVVIQMAASAINHGDKTFLKRPASVGAALPPVQHDVWGASGAGTVIAIGDGVPARYLGRQVAVYRSLGRSTQSIGLWSEQAQMPYTNCLILPDHVAALDYSGSLVNVMTAYAFIEEIVAAGHRGIIVTAGHSATGNAMAALARQRNLPVIFLVRTDAARDALHAAGVEHVIVTHEGYTTTLAERAAQLGTTAVFDGVGGRLLSEVATALPVNSTIWCYGFLDAASPMAFPTALVMGKNLVIRRFSNFDSATVRDRSKLEAALEALEKVIDDPLFRTRVGATFAYEQIEAAMAYEGAGGVKAVLTA